MRKLKLVPALSPKPNTACLLRIHCEIICKTTSIEHQTSATTETMQALAPSPHSNNLYAVRANWIAPVDQPPIRDGMIVINRTTNRISAIGTQNELARDDIPISNLGNVTLIPGLVNAHTHLEFSDLDRPLGHAGIEFTDWIKAIVEQRSKTNQTLKSKRLAIQRGLKESFSSGVWAVGDIATGPVLATDYVNPTSSDHLTHSLHRTVFLEQLGRKKDQLEHQKKIANDFCSNLNQSADPLLQPAFSPHAPYSTDPKLVRQLCELANQHHTPVAMHLAETQTERELLESQTGPFVDLLQSFGVWNPDSFEPKVSILDLLQILATAPRSLVIHGNYLNERELDFVTEHRDQMSVVFCPRTHHYFHHDHYPLASMLARGINIAMGTDSRASNPDLQIVRELTYLHRTMPEIAPAQLLSTATIAGAKALGIDDQCGSLTPGKLAAISAITPETNADSPTPFGWMTEPHPTCRPVIDGNIAD